MKQATFYSLKNQVISAIEKSASKMNLQLEESTENELVYFHNGSQQSFSNRISVMFSQSGKDKVKVSVSSRLAAQDQLIDGGTNQKLENNLISEISGIVPKWTLSNR